jgi:hypothetical protein
MPAVHPPEAGAVRIFPTCASVIRDGIPIARQFTKSEHSASYVEIPIDSGPLRVQNPHQMFDCRPSASPKATAMGPVPLPRN